MASGTPFDSHVEALGRSPGRAPWRPKGHRWRLWAPLLSGALAAWAGGPSKPVDPSALQAPEAERAMAERFRASMLGHRPPRWEKGCLVQAGALLPRADLSLAHLASTDLRGANLREADLSLADLRGCDLRDADLSGANLEGADLYCADLGGARLRGARLAHARLRHADLTRADLQEAILTRADLAHARLDHADLRQAALGAATCEYSSLLDVDLRGADLSGADLLRAQLTGARLAGARLFKTDILWAIGLDLTGAEVHPFFREEPLEAVGDVRLLDFGDDPQAGKEPPCCLVAAADGRLVWLTGRASTLHLLGPTGAAAELTHRQGAQGEAAGALPSLARIQLDLLAKDAEDRLWGLGREVIIWCPLKDLRPGSSDARVRLENMNAQFPAPPDLLAPGPRGHVWISMQNQALHFRVDLSAERPPKSGREVSWGPLQRPPLPSLEGLRAFPTRDGAWLVLTAPHAGAFHVRSLVNGRTRPVALPVHARPQALVEGPDQRVWFPDPGRRTLGWLDPKTLQLGELRPGPGRVWEEPAGLALGPDGALWFTDRKGCAIGRMTLDGSVCQRFPLPRGCRPEEIVAGADGRMYFTLAGKRRLGSIRAVPVPGQAALSAPAAPEAGADPVPGPPLAEPEQRVAALLAEEPEAPEPLPLPPVSTRPEGAPARAPEEPNPAPADPQSPLARLRRQGINLTPRALRHILARHGEAGPQDRSRFLPAYQHPERLAALLATGLDHAGAALARIRVVNHQGRFLTLCQAPGVVGWTQAYGHWTETRSFLVVTARWQGAHGAPEQDVISAYPVKADW